MAKKRGSRRFAVGMVIYALVFLALTAVGLKFFWDFIEAYEQSRPKNTVSAYVEGLTAEKMCASSQKWLSEIDHRIQSGDECVRIIRDSLAEEITYAKKAGECTDTRQVYVLRSGERVIGECVLCAGETDKYGFSRWEVTEEHFDFSYLEGEAVSVTVPREYTVRAGGCVLDDSYLTETGIPYSLLEEFYDDYELPTLVTYTADHFLGTISLEVTDPDGNPVAVGEDTDWNAFLDNCTDEEREELETLVTGFLTKYVKFSGSASRAVSRNFAELKAYLVPDGALAQRLWTAADGLKWAQSNGDTIDSIEIHHYVRLDGERYLCDATYLVNTVGKKGTVQTTNNIKVMIVQTENGLRVEAMTSY